MPNVDQLDEELKASKLKIFAKNLGDNVNKQIKRRDEKRLDQTKL